MDVPDEFVKELIPLLMEWNDAICDEHHEYWSVDGADDTRIAASNFVEGMILSVKVFIATMSLYIFGGGAINDFAFTFLIGIITGTYSSIYIASALVLWWHGGQRPKTNASTVVLTDTTAARP